MRFPDKKTLKILLPQPSPFITQISKLCQGLWVNPRNENPGYAYGLDAYKRHRMDLISEKPSFRGRLAQDTMRTWIRHILYISVMTNEYCETRYVIYVINKMCIELDRRPCTACINRLFTVVRASGVTRVRVTRGDNWWVSPHFSSKKTDDLCSHRLWRVTTFSLPVVSLPLRVTSDQN